MTAHKTIPGELDTVPEKLHMILTKDKGIQIRLKRELECEKAYKEYHI